MPRGCTDAQVDGTARALEARTGWAEDRSASWLAVQVPLDATEVRVRLGP